MQPPPRLQVPQGAWFTLMLSALLFIVCITWHWAHGLKLRYIREHAAPLRSLVQEGAGAGDVGAGGQSHLEGRQLRLFSGRGPAVNRVPGVGIYYNELLDGAQVSRAAKQRVCGALCCAICPRIRALQARCFVLQRVLCK